MLDQVGRTDARGDQAGVGSVEVAGALLRAMLRAAGPAKLVDLARAAGMPSAKAHRYLVSLARTGLAMRDPATGRYDLGPLALQIGLRGFVRFAPLRAAEGTLNDLVAAVGETCVLSVWGEDGPAIVRVAEARHVFAGSVAVRHRCPLTWSATGMVFCAFGDPERTEPLIARDLEQNRVTGRRLAPHDRPALDAMVRRVRAAGLAAVADGGGEGRVALAAPVFDATGGLAMAVTVFGRLGRMDAAEDGALAGLLRAAAATLSGTLGHEPVGGHGAGG